MIEKIRQLSRAQWELVAAIVIVIFGLTAFLVPIKTQGALTYDDGKITYTGAVVNHRMNGEGTLTYENGDVYKGHFVNGVFQGQGTFTSAKGWTYTGEFDNGQANGKGTLTAVDGTVYKGTFVQGIYQK